jgi:uncharacterized protein (DUF1800 family)
MSLAPAAAIDLHRTECRTEYGGVSAMPRSFAPLAPDDDPLSAFVPKDADLFDSRKAAHLLRRSGFGAPFEDVERAMKQGLETTVDSLLDLDTTQDEFAPLAESLEGTLVDFGNADHLRTWWLYRMQTTKRPLEEKLALFWHGHFATSIQKVQRADLMHGQNKLFRRYALGPFRSLVLGVAKDPAMLRYLDGNTNKKGSPNENFARELLELFTMGPGHYSEKDVMEAARAFTGWHTNYADFQFVAAQHDCGVKTILGETGDWNGDDVIDIVLRRAATARFLATKLFEFFCHPNPPERVVASLADDLLRSQYALKGVLRRLFLSRVFYSRAAWRAVVKSPVELVVGAAREQDSKVNLMQFVRALRNLGQELFAPPTVKGWDGGAAWLTSALVLERVNFAMSFAHARSVEDGSRIFPDVVCQKRGLDTPEKVLVHYVSLCLQDDLPEATRQSLRDYLSKNDGEKDRPWTNDYRSFNSKVRGLIHMLIASPEYQLA